MKNKVLLLSFFLLSFIMVNAQILNTRTNTNYTDLQSAINAAIANDVLELTENINIAGNTILVNKKLTIDGKGYTISQNNSVYSFNFTAAGSTLQNVKIKKTNNNGQYIIAAHRNDLTFDNVTVEGQSSFQRSAHAFETAYNTKNLVITNCHFQWLNTVGYFNPGTTAQITNTTNNTTSGWNVHYEDAIEFVGNNWNTGVNVAFLNVRNLAGGSANSENNWFTCRITKIVAENSIGGINKISNNQDGVNTPPKFCGNVYNLTQYAYYYSISDAIANADDNDELKLQGNIIEAPTTDIIVNKSITFNGDGHIITTTGNYNLFRLMASESTLENLHIEKTDDVNQNLIYIGGDNITIDGIHIIGNYQMGDSEVTRGIEVASGNDGLTVKNCSFKHIRQPAYINPVTNATIENSDVAHTRGWVVVASAEVTFLGNTWGSGEDANAVDIAIIDDNPTISQENIYFTCPVMKQIEQDNNNPKIINEVVGCDIHNETQDTYYATVQGAIDAADDGDVISVYPGEYTENANYNPSNNTNSGNNPLGLLINKSVTIQGVDADGNVINDVEDIEATIIAGYQGNWGTNMFVTAPDVTIQGLTLLGSTNTHQSPYTDKVIEVVENNFTLLNCIIDTQEGLDLSSSVYINDRDSSGYASNPTEWQSAIGSYNISNNILRGSFVTTNGPGTNLEDVDFVIQDNLFEDSLVDLPEDTYSNGGIYVTGSDDVIAWRNAPATFPTTITGNTFAADLSRLLLARDDDAANLPTTSQIQDFFANNTIGNAVYVTDSEGLYAGTYPTETTFNVLITPSISEAITAAGEGTTVNVTAGTYTENLAINKSINLYGPNNGTSGTGDRVEEAILENGNIIVSGATTVVIDGLHILRTDSGNGDTVQLGGAATATVQNCIFERNAATAGDFARAITTSAGAGVKNINNNLFTGDTSGGLFGGHKTWQSGIYGNFAGSLVNIENNTFENTRAAINADDFNNGIVIGGNNFGLNGTQISFGGTTPTDGSYALSSNNFGTPASALINLSNVATSFRLDITSSTFNNDPVGDLTLEELFAVESGMYHRGRSGRNGLVYYNAGHQYVNNGQTTIQSAVDAAAQDDVILVSSGTFNEDVVVNKSVTVNGAFGYDNTTVSGPIGGEGATFRVASSGVTISGFTITRDGNNTEDWNNPDLNFAGIAIQGQANDAKIRDNYITENRTGIDVNNSDDNVIEDNIIDNNRTGLIFRNQTEDTQFTGNKVTNNWTVGILFLDMSSGTNSPVQSAAGSHFNENDISGNWYGDVVDRQDGATANAKDFSCNWFGTSSAPVFSTEDSNEPGYGDLIPTMYGGSGIPPEGPQPDILGAASASVTADPFLISNNLENPLCYGFTQCADASAATFGMNVTEITETTATLNWNTIPGTAYYQIWTAALGVTNVGSDTSYDLEGLTAGTEYSWSVRAVCVSLVTSEWSQSTFTTAGSAPILCLEVTEEDLSIDADVTETTATLSWSDEIVGVESYQIWSSMTGMVYNISGASYEIENLDPGTTYQWQLRALCSQGYYSDWFASEFTTAGSAPILCTEVTEEHFNYSYLPSGTTVDVSWDAIHNSIGYQLWVPHLGGQVITLPASTTTYQFTGLSPWTHYNLSIRSLCAGGGSSDWIAVEFYSTNGFGITVEEGILGLDALTLYPNPVSDVLNIQLPITVEKAESMVVYDVNGRVIHQQVDVPGNAYTLNVNDFRPGVYFLNIQVGTEVFNKRFVVK